MTTGMSHKLKMLSQEPGSSPGLPNSKFLIGGKYSWFVSAIVSWISDVYSGTHV